MKKRTAVLVCFFVLGAAFLFAHAPLLDLFDNGDGTFTCVGGFSNGASAAGAEIRIENPKEKDPVKKVVFKGKLDKNGELVVPYPKDLSKFIIVFDAGSGHILKKTSDKIQK